MLPESGGGQVAAGGGESPLATYNSGWMPVFLLTKEHVYSAAELKETTERSRNHDGTRSETPTSTLQAQGFFFLKKRRKLLRVAIVSLG